MYFLFLSLSIANYKSGICSVLLRSLLERKVQGFFPKEEALSYEYELVHQAIFTDPDDQSGWFYYLWLLDQTLKTDAPLLVSSFPAHGSDIILSRDRRFDESPLHSFHSESGTFPLVLYFNEAVEGVSSATVTVESSFCTNNDLIWKPLSINNSNAARVWVAHVKFPDKELQQAYPMEVSLGHSQGIISSGGFDYNHHTQIAFKVCARSLETETTEEHDEKMISWKDEIFHILKTQSREPNPFISFGQLTIDADHEPTTAEWREETIANEISLFRELLSEISW